MSITIILILLGIVWLISIFPGMINDDSDSFPVCGDGSLYNTCSLRKPNFCSDGVLIERASLCGCSNNLTINGDSCISEYQVNPKNISLKYILRGETNELNLTVYEGMINYLLGLPSSIKYYGDDTPSRVDFKLKNLDNEQQRPLLLPLVTQIQNIAENEEDQVRIAVSLVQNLEWGWSNKTTKFKGLDLQYSRHPYEVLFDTQGVCGEKSELLSFILREMGYGVVFFYNQEENHESIGIKCPLEESWKNTGYCFVETTGPSIITDNSIQYIGGLTLNSTPEVLLISEGNSLPDNMYEYKDAQDMTDIRNSFINGETIITPKKLLTFKKLEKKYGLVKEYNAA